MTTYFSQDLFVPATNSQGCSSSSCYWSFAPSTSQNVQPYYPVEELKLNDLIEDHFESNRITSNKQQAVNNLLANLQYFLDSDEYLMGSKLEIFGSFANGLGSNSGDVDLSLHWPHSEKLDKWEKINVLQMIIPMLYKAGCFDILPVFNAKVPIVKFNYIDGDTGIELDADISINNELALQNTRLIRQYCKWEPYRLPRLAAFVKYWAKSQDIGSAASGSLSSYAHTCLLINYLQSCSPPVLPRLQEDFRSSADKVEDVDGSDVYFFKCIMTGWTRNRMSVAELFQGFLSYYASFDFEHKVIQIRSRNFVTKNMKGWTTAITIEDPFITSYNLGLHARDCSKILLTIKKSAEVFNSSFEIFRKEVDMQRGWETSQTDYSRMLKDHLMNTISKLVDPSRTEETVTAITSNRLAETPLNSPRYNKQPLWIPPCSQDMNSLIPYNNDTYFDNINSCMFYY